MAEWVYYFNLAAAASGLMAALLGLTITVTAPYMEQWNRRYLGFMFLLLSAYIASDLIEQIVFYFFNPDLLWLARVGVFFELLFSVAIVLSFTAYLLRCANEDIRSSLLFRTALVVYLIYIGVLVFAQFSESVYIFSSELKCVLPGPFGAVLFVPPLVLMVLNLVGFWRRRTKLTPRQRAAYVICNIGPLLSTLAQAALYGASILVIGTSLSALAMLGFIIVDQMDAHVRQLEESNRRRAQVMALQLRPHFIYNVMTSIYYLCAQDPERAQQVTLDFTDYLRANYDAVAQEGDVPFSKELEHTRAYLAVEQARLDDGLVVAFDCPHTAFRLPPLTLQPLVENAVKHGADPELPPLHVRVATREEAGYFVVSVEDTGPGYETGEGGKAGDKGTGSPSLFSETGNRSLSHSGTLSNIRERLLACGATLEITPREGGGTLAAIRIPKAKIAKRRDSPNG